MVCFPVALNLPDLVHPVYEPFQFLSMTSCKDHNDDPLDFGVCVFVYVCVLEVRRLLHTIKKKYI